ncbi:MAG: purine-binding chemotaxis protein CheW [Pseudothermotoga sp.]|uniref:chemotaxis protein CheW n=1 Tax=Pseudothermotoga sp. TaxID=2033661 RepID=UPI000E948E42|nr:purine-binding chemotaxis protein CheW [Pseudothermotoga sp.]MDK2923407.1 purine-binding chemotaxis protein CheW [Pseudothermotoga sp.]HBT38879.1 hypothetical protein [Pseudothermotoga sp.]HCO97872.1 hypothetical protein [Pseudothermotoga sp.]
MNISTLEQYVTFILGEETYAVPVTNVREIVKASKITRVPLAPAHIEGVMNLRGEVLPIINLRRLLGLPEHDPSLSKVVVLTQNDRTIGILVDRTAQVIRSTESEQQDTRAESRFVKKVLRTNTGMCLLFNIDELFEEETKKLEARSSSALQQKSAETTVTKAENYIQLVSFELSGGIYAFKITGVQEIIRYAQPTPIPNAPEYMMGLIELRKSVLPIVDMRRLLDLPATKTDEFTKVIVLRVGGSHVGVVVDRIREVLRIDESKVLPPPSLEREKTKELVGVIQNGDEMILVVDHEELLSDKVVGAQQQEQEEAVERLTTEEEKQYVIFNVGGEEYGVQIEEIREINRLTALAKVPRAPEYLEGLMNLRGEIVPVVDLRKKFNLVSSEKNEQTERVVVTESDGKKIAFIVDSVVGVRRIPTSAISDLPETLSDSESARFISKIARIENRVVLLLQMSRVLSEQEKETVTTAAEKTSSKQDQQSKKLRRLK